MGRSMLSRARRLFILAVTVALCVTTSSVSADNALVITRGGTYTGNFSRVIINTGEPVTLENATLRGEGALISSHYQHANVTIRNVRGCGIDDAHHAGRFVNLEGFDNVAIENCSLERTCGVYLLDYAGDRTPAHTVKIFRNCSRNIDGRKPDGKGGYGQDARLVQFVQLDKVRHVPGVEIAWNEVVNEPRKSCVEDNVNIYLSSGTPDSPIRIHDNFIRGGYSGRPERDEYSGGGILLGDGVAKGGPEDDAAFVHAFDNQVLDTSNYGIAISAGHDCQIYRNRILSAGVLPDGTPIAAQNVGAYVWDSYKAGKQHFFNNSGRANLIGWIKGTARNDWWTPDAATWENNEAWPEPIAPAAYDLEWKRWQDKLKTAGVTVGPKE